MSWTDERIEQLRTLWTQGRSASEIAAIFGDVSRNAVIGKAHRLGLSGRPSPIKKADAKPRRPEPQQRRLAVVHTFGERQCKWPVGDPKDPDFHFCGCAAQPGMPYCAEHAAIAYQPTRSKREDERKYNIG